MQTLRKVTALQSFRYSASMKRDKFPYRGGVFYFYKNLLNFLRGGYASTMKNNLGALKGWLCYPLKSVPCALEGWLRYHSKCNRYL